MKLLVCISFLFLNNISLNFSRLKWYLFSQSFVGLLVTKWWGSLLRVSQAKIKLLNEGISRLEALGKILLPASFKGWAGLSSFWLYNWRSYFLIVQCSHCYTSLTCLVRWPPPFSRLIQGFFLCRISGFPDPDLSFFAQM